MKWGVVFIIIIAFTGQVKAKNIDKNGIFCNEEMRYALNKTSYNYEKWDTRDTILELGFFTIAGIDLWQTYKFLYIEKDGNEKNSILGKYPSKQKLFFFAGAWGMLHISISRLLPCHSARNSWQIITIIGHSYAVGNNFNLGTRISF